MAQQVRRQVLQSLNHDELMAANGGIIPRLLTTLAIQASRRLEIRQPIVTRADTINVRGRKNPSSGFGGSKLPRTKPPDAPQNEKARQKGGEPNRLFPPESDPVIP